MRRLLVVLGMHHSGSNLLARALGHCGARIGEEHGRDLRDICERLLQAVGADWWKVWDSPVSSIPEEVLLQQRGAFGTLIDALGALDTSVIVEPRLCLLLSALRPQTRDLVCIHIHRNPLDVARSLRAENGYSIAEGLALWQMYNSVALQAATGAPRVLVSYEALVADPHECMDKLLQDLSELGVSGLASPGHQTLEGAISSCGDHPGRSDEAERVLTGPQDALWQWLVKGEVLRAQPKLDLDSAAVELLRNLGLRKALIEPFSAGLEKQNAVRETLERGLGAKSAQILELKSEAKENSSEIDILNKRVELMDAQIAEIHASRSWRITAPLRSVSAGVQEVRAAIREVRGNKGLASGLSSRVGRYLGNTFLGWRGSSAKKRGRLPATLEGEDTFVLYRIIGNDLHPRHKHGQAIENLRFIAEHEPTLAGCEKRFILNRILDADQEREIIGLLEQHGFGYLRIPFDAGEYARIGFDTDILPEPEFLSGEGIDSLDDAEKDRLFAALYRLKNNYVMNNNGARNAALLDGSGRAKWILPWDGNCFLTRDAWEGIRADISMTPGNRYFIVPMARMLDNEPLIVGGDIPKAAEEPQIIFRADATEQFNPAFCYGRRPKVELLWRLGVKGPWDKYSDDAWDQKRLVISSDSVLVGKAGWVARLFSGMSTLEANNDHATLHRGFARSGAIMATLQHLDAKVANMDSEHPVSIRAQALQQEAEHRNSPALRGIVDALFLAADAALDRWSDPMVHPKMQQVFDDSLVLALAYSFTGEARYADLGARILERLFVDPDTRVEMHPGHDRLADGNDCVPDASDRVLEMRGMYCYLDAVRIFERAGSIGGPVKAGFRVWLATRLKWLLSSTPGIRERRAGDHRGTCYELQVAAIASYLDDQEAVYGALVRAQARISGQFAPDGSQPEELKDTATAHNCCFNFQSWIYLAELASRWGVDLWGYRARDGSGLEQGARWLLSRVGRPWPGEQVEDFDADRFQPIRFAASEFLDAPPKNERHGCSPYDIKPIFEHQAGIRPFWSLASHGLPVSSSAVPLGSSSCDGSQRDGKT